jgi:hypothetical protein
VSWREISSTRGRCFDPDYFASDHFLLIAEAHKSKVRAGFCLLLIADTHIQKANWPDSADIGLRYSQFMRLNDEQQVISADGCARSRPRRSALVAAQALRGCMNWK